ncbi:MAG: hypothetical protein KAI76_09295 [Alphaproteobacteria bacterium]|nr:hypothetical protein [Alphaproteobacteria bacterium]
MKNLLLVDFENVQQVDLSKLDGSFHIIIFVGANQKNIPTALVIKNQKLGNRLEWMQIEGNGKNALDFCIAYELGKVFEKEPQLECVILSKDKGFEPLLNNLKKKGRKCKRVETLQKLK